MAVHCEGSMLSLPTASGLSWLAVCAQNLGAWCGAVCFQEVLKSLLQVVVAE